MHRIVTIIGATIVLAIVLLISLHERQLAKKHHKK